MDRSTLEAWATWAFSPSLSAIFITLFISLVSPLLVHYYLYRKAVSKEFPSILLLGPSGAGKTSLLTLLSNSQPSQTHTSQEPQTALVSLPSTIRAAGDRFRSTNDTSSTPQFLLLDTPGHGKLRSTALTSLTQPSHWKGILFLLDASAPTLTEAAEYLHDVLLILQKRTTQAKTSKVPEGVRVCVGCNKQDVFSSLPPSILKGKLEVEIGKVRESRGKGLVDSGVALSDDGVGREEGEDWLGEFNHGGSAKGYTFAEMREFGVEIEAVGGSVKEGEEGVQGLWEWIGGCL